MNETVLSSAVRDYNDQDIEGREGCGVIGAEVKARTGVWSRGTVKMSLVTAYEMAYTVDPV